MIASVLQRRRAALLSVDWDIRQVSDADPVLAQEQAEVLGHVYDQVDNFRDAMAFLFSGVFRGYAHLEKHYSEAGLIHRLEPVEQWFWVRDGLFGDWQYNENAVSGRYKGMPIERNDFVIFETAPLNRILSMLYLRKNLSQKDWDSFLEVYGIPSIFLVGPPNTPSAKEEEYQTIAEQIISDGRDNLKSELRQILFSRLQRYQPLFICNCSQTYGSALALVQAVDIFQKRYLEKRPSLVVVIPHSFAVDIYQPIASR